MKQLILFWLLLFTLLGCKEEEKPPFSKEKFQAILTQIHLTDASASSLYGEVKDSISIVYMDQVKKINKITDEEIESIFIYLKNHPGFAEEVYQGMITDINKIQSDAKAKKKEEKDKKAAEKKAKEEAKKGKK